MTMSTGRARGPRPSCDRRAERGRIVSTERPGPAKYSATRSQAAGRGCRRVGQYPRRRAPSRSTVGSMTTKDGDGAVTTIRANCPSCGDVQLTADDLTVRVCADDERGSYCFRCPDCQGAVAKEASRRIVDLLVSSGVRMQVWRLPAELTESRVGAAAHARRPPRLPPAPRGRGLVRAARRPKCVARSTG